MDAIAEAAFKTAVHVIATAKWRPWKGATSHKIGLRKPATFYNHFLI